MPGNTKQSNVKWRDAVNDPPEEMGGYPVTLEHEDARFLGAKWWDGKEWDTDFRVVAWYAALEPFQGEFDNGE